MQGSRLYTNSGKQVVLNPFLALASQASELKLAAPYFCRSADISEKIDEGKRVSLIVGLNPITDPFALRQLLGRPGVAIRYFTHRFHAKIFLFDSKALVGSANLTDAGFMQNREATVLIDEEEDPELIDDLRFFFTDLWASAAVLTPEILEDFRVSRGKALAAQDELERALMQKLPRSEPRSIRVESRVDSPEKLFLQELHRLVHERYGPAFSEIGRILQERGLNRDELVRLSPATQVNRFLNWVRLEHAVGDVWKETGRLDPSEREDRVAGFGRGWETTGNSRIDPYFFEWHDRVQETFGSRKALEEANKEKLTAGLLSLHAFSEQLRFTKGGHDALGPSFWAANGEDLEKVRATLLHLLYGGGDFIVRLHDTLFDPSFKLARFGKFTALELYGTIRPEECPPMNGRMAKAMSYLGYDTGG